MARLIILVGLPGSGKSCYAEGLALTPLLCNHGEEIETVIHSSDQIREELFGDANCQDNNQLVFETLHKRVKEDLRKGYTVIYDATNVTRKSRRSVINLATKDDIVECHILWAPIQTCIRRDKDRDRSVGYSVIDKFVRRWQSPWYDEGIHKIEIINTDLSFDPPAYIRSMTLNMCIPHNNPHHQLGVMEHCEQAYQNLQDIYILPKVVEYATLWHDIGKPYTKGYKNKPNSSEIDYSIAHYYDHQNVGAYLAYGLYLNLDPITLQDEHDFIALFSWLINNHMEPFFNSKYYNKLPSKLKEYIDAIHKADISAH